MAWWKGEWLNLVSKISELIYGVDSIIKQNACERVWSRKWICIETFYKPLEFSSKIWSSVRTLYYKTPQWLINSILKHFRRICFELGWGPKWLVIGISNIRKCFVIELVNTRSDFWREFDCYITEFSYNMQHIDPLDQSRSQTFCFIIVDSSIFEEFSVDWSTSVPRRPFSVSSIHFSGTYM